MANTTIVPLLTLVTTRDNGSRLYQEATYMLAQLAENVPVPVTIVQNLNRSLRNGYRQAETLLVDILINRETHLSVAERFAILKSLAQNNKNAAMACALASISRGTCPLPAGDYPDAWLYFSRAAALGNQHAFNTMLDAICKGQLGIKSQDFIDACRHIVSVARNDFPAIAVEASFVLGMLLCNQELTQWSPLSKLGLNKPDMGFHYLHFVIKHDPNSEMGQKANAAIREGFAKDLFKCQEALDLKAACLQAMKSSSPRL